MKWGGQPDYQGSVGAPFNAIESRMHKQKAHLVTIAPSGQVRGLDELNVAFGRGWTFVSATPLGGSTTAAEGGSCMATLVVIEREDRSAEAFLEAVEEEADELLDDLVEGDGSNKDIDIDPEV